jgi:hypothetical protein
MPAMTYGITTVFEAPLGYVYEWCTDFRDDDPQIVGASFTRHILKKTKEGVVWIQHYKKDLEEREGVRTVKLDPPDAWHLKSFNDEVSRIGEYRLTKLGEDRTRLKIVIKSRYKGVEPEPKAKLQAALQEDWRKYKAALESDYSQRKMSLPGKGRARAPRESGRPPSRRVSAAAERKPRGSISTQA